MNPTDTPNDPPPAYSANESQSRTQGAPAAGTATGGGAAAGGGSTSATAGAGAGAPASTSQSTGATTRGRQPRRGNSRTEELDIQQEERPLPPGWVHQYSQEHDRFFFVDTKAPGGARSIWTHPLDDEQWLKTVPEGTDPLSYVHQLWANEPEPSPTGVPNELPPDWQPRQQSQSQPQQAQASGSGVRQGGTHAMQSDYPGTPTMQGGQRRKITVEDLTQYYLSKMGTPEEYERKNPPGALSKKFHKNETPAQRQRRHAEKQARDLAETITYRVPAYGPGSYGYPGYGRGYYGGGLYSAAPGYGYAPYGYGMGRRPMMGGPLGMGMGAGLLGLGTGAMLGGAFF